MMYTIEQHVHNLAAWQAATAARASNKCRFSVKTGKVILEAAGFDESFSVEDLPTSEVEIDQKHKEWRMLVIAKSGQLKFTHGIAAKLINCYLKARFVCGGYHAEPRVQLLHPPIDAVLLAGLRKAEPPVKCQDEWKQHRNTRWSKLNSDDYQKIIDLIRKTMCGQPLWMVEKYWQGYQ